MRHDVYMKSLRALLGLAVAVQMVACTAGAFAQPPHGGGPGGAPVGGPPPGSGPGNRPATGPGGGVGILFQFPLFFGQRNPEPPPKLLTDSFEYCNQLAGQVNNDLARTTRPPVDAMELAAEGQHLCAIGHLRPGIQRLKMAIKRLQYRP